MFDESADRVSLEGFVRSDGSVVSGRLSGRAPGTFVWRSSRQNGGLAASYVDASGTIVHVLYVLHADPSGVIHICVDKSSPQGYLSIVDAVADWPNIYRVSLLDLERQEAQNGLASPLNSPLASPPISSSAASGASPDMASYDVPQTSMLTDDESRYLMVRRTVERSATFDGGATRDEVETRLSGHPPGTFVFRNSSSVPGDYTLSVVDQGGDISHTRLSCLRSGFLLYDGHRYASLSEFIVSKRYAGLMTEPLTGREFEALHTPPGHVLASPTISSSSAAPAALGAGGSHTACPPPPSSTFPASPTAVPSSSSPSPPVSKEAKKGSTSFIEAILDHKPEASLSGRITPPQPSIFSLPPLPPPSTASSPPLPTSPIATATTTTTTTAIVPSSATTASPCVPDNSAKEEDETNVCVVCLDNKIDVILLECGHVCACSDCASLLSSCPMCRAPIVRFVKMFFAH